MVVRMMENLDRIYLHEGFRSYQSGRQKMLIGLGENWNLKDLLLFVFPFLLGLQHFPPTLSLLNLLGLRPMSYWPVDGHDDLGAVQVRWYLFGMGSGGLRT